MAVMITKPGEVLPKVEKRASETITFLLDLANILEKNEVARNISTATSTLELANVRTRKGKFIELQILPSDNGASQFLEHQVSVLFETTMGNTRSAVFSIRVHK